MLTTLGVPEEWKEPLGRFVTERGVILELVGQGESAVEVVTEGAGKRCTRRRLYTGGTIACETARAMAGALGLTVRQMGELLNLLHIKVRQCGLGCFK